jgi:hypothetical protein
LLKVETHARLGVVEEGDTVFHLLPGGEDGGGGGRGGGGGGWLDDGVICGREGGTLVDGLIEVGFKANLPSKRPGTLHSGIISEGAQQLVVRGGEVLVDGILLTNTVGLEVGGSGQGVLLVLEDESAGVIREKLDDNWRG